MRASIRQVALHASVSPKTVTNVLRGRGGETSATTRQRVLQSVQELGYVPVASPTQNRHVETRVIGVVFDQIDAAHDFYGLMNFRGLRQGALETGYDLLVMLQPQPDWAAGREEARFLDRRTDGFIFVLPRNRTPLFQSLVAHDIPVVSCHEVDVPRGVAHVAGDNVMVGRLATEYVIGRGHTRIAHWPGVMDRSYFQQRRTGFRQAMTNANLDAFELPAARSTLPDVERSLITEIKRRKITAVVCANDGYALALHKGVEDAGLHVPRDLSIIGGDDIPEAEATGLSTIRLDMASVGHGAMLAMSVLVAGRAAQSCHRSIAVHLVERASVAALKSEKPKS